MGATKTVVLTRLVIYFTLLGVLFMIPFTLSKSEKKHTTHTTKKSVKVTLIAEKKPQPKKRVLPKPKPKPKKKPKPKPKPKPKKKIIPKPKPLPKPKPIIEPEIEVEPTPQKEIIQKEILLPQIQEQITQPTEVDTISIKQTYYSQVRSTIEANKKYPKKARRFKHQGDVKVKFSINADGSVNRLEIVEPSRYNTLNKAVKKMFNRLTFSKPPRELETPLNITITINFTLK